MNKYMQAVEEGRITRRKHETKDLWIYNYTPMTQYKRDWDELTLKCRGLIVDAEGKVVAQSFKKFFNFGEDGAGEDRSGDEMVRVLDKADGQLFIGFVDDEGDLVVSTRGSFHSEQAEWARQWLAGRGVDGSQLERGVTYLGEIIFREGRIVLDYGDFEGIIGLGVVRDGRFDPDAGEESGLFNRMREDFGRMRLDEALKMGDREGAEGLVLIFDDGEMLKIKQEDYVQMHRIVTGLNSNRVYEVVVKGEDAVNKLRQDIPDELYEWFDSEVKMLVESYESKKARITEVHRAVKDSLDSGAGKKEFALALKNGGYENWEVSGAFMIENGRDMEEYLWKLVKSD